MDLSNVSEKKNYSEFIGDIQLDPKTDGEFIRCDKFSNQYYGIKQGLKYKGEMAEIKSDIKANFKSNIQANQSGFITIRFLVNCNGMAGMYRVHSSDLSLREFKFDKKIVSQLLSATKKLQDWEIAEYNGIRYDYYQYLTFKFIEGKIIDITP